MFDSHQVLMIFKVVLCRGKPIFSSNITTPLNKRQTRFASNQKSHPTLPAEQPRNMKTKLSEFPTPLRPAQTPGVHADSRQTTAAQSPPPNPPAIPSVWTFPGIGR